MEERKKALQKEMNLHDSQRQGNSGDVFEVKYQNN